MSFSSMTNQNSILSQIFTLKAFWITGFLFYNYLYNFWIKLFEILDDVIWWISDFRKNKLQLKIAAQMRSKDDEATVDINYYIKIQYLV